MTKSYQVHEFAVLAGVTVRTLHHYDRLALLRPKRTDAGYRLYGIGDLERLEQIVALKFLGLPLKRIKNLLERDTRELCEVLPSQRRALEEKRRRLDQAIGAIRDAERIIRPGQQTDAAALKTIIEVIEMQNNADFMNKYYSEEAQAKMAERRAEWNPELQEQATAAWTALFRDVDILLAPATPCRAPRLEQTTFVLDGREMLVRPNIGLFTQPISFIGLPVVAVPIPLAPLPIGIQVIAAPWREDVALRIAYALEGAGVAAAPRPSL